MTARVLDTPDPDDPGAPVHEPVAGPPPSGDDVREVLRGVIDPELHASIVDLGMRETRCRWANSGLGLRAPGRVAVVLGPTLRRFDLQH